jgi:hypothetical protein
MLISEGFTSGWSFQYFAPIRQGSNHIKIRSAAPMYYAEYTCILSYTATLLPMVPESSVHCVAKSAVCNGTGAAGQPESPQTHSPTLGRYLV